MPSILSKEIPQEAIEACQQIYSENKIFWLLSVLLSCGGISYYSITKFLRRSKVISQAAKEIKSKFEETKNKIKATVDKRFFDDLKNLIFVAIPSIWSREIFYLIILAFLLVIRTTLSIRIADVNGTIVKAIVNRQFWTFLMRIATLGSIAIPASFVNAWLSYFTSRLALQFRTRLVHYFHDLYLAPMMYYKVSNIDSRIINPDQAMTETLTLWGRSLSELYSNLTKPILDIVLFSLKLSELMGWQGPLSVVGYYAISFLLIRLISPPFGTLAALTQRFEGAFRSSHHRLITHSEEIAFYNGHNREKEILNEQYQILEKHNKFVLGQKFAMETFNGFLQKYGSIMCGYTVLGLPVFGSKAETYLQSAETSSDITQDYIRNSSLLINLSKAIGRIVISYEDLQRLAGYTKLVTKMRNALIDLQNGLYVRDFVDPQKLKEKKLSPNSGQRIAADFIKFEKVSIITPNGDILVNEMDFEIHKGENLMIVGPNGCGKSSLFRILGGLWPLWDGKLQAPKESDIFYIPQKPYLVVGTFRDQVIYPDTFEQMHEKKWTDEQLEELLDQVKLTPLLEKQKAENGWDTRKDWFEVLSGGEKQRIAMARVFYHQPKFAILDECTSAVSVDVEGYMYTHCKEIGITLITISHRPSLWKYHEKRLDMDGRGGYKFGQMILPNDYTGIP